jgi:collagenase-like PrtC family protease
MNQDSISFDLGCNFDYKLFDYIDAYDKKHAINSFFGKLKYDGLPGGRAAAIIPDFTMDEFADYLKECKKHDIVFNYLINPLSMDQNEIDPEVGKQIRDFIHTLYDMGVRAVTLNSHLLIKYVKREFKDMFVTLGLYAYPVSIQHIEYWRNWGVDEITLDHGFNRRFDLLRKLLSQYKDSDLHLRVIANNLCLRECPFRLAHGSFVGHSDPNKYTMDYSLINCVYKKVTNPTAILTSDFIRPEDVHYYRELAEETGNKNFSIKLVDRTNPTDFLHNVIKSYMEESYEGNLLDLVNWPRPKTIAMFPPNVPKGAGAPPVGAGGPPADMPGLKSAPHMRWGDRLKPEAMMNYGRTLNPPKIYVDNKKLDGFLEHFINNNNCANSLCACDILEDGQTAPNACAHCSTWAKKVISYDEAEVAQWKELCGSVLRNIEDNSIYKY